jgi:hypothetical protein
MLSALDGRPFLVLGSSQRDEVCVEQMWQQHLDTLAWKKRAAEGRRRKKRHTSTQPGEPVLACADSLLHPVITVITRSDATHALGG